MVCSLDAIELNMKSLKSVSHIHKCGFMPVKQCLRKTVLTLAVNTYSLWFINFALLWISVALVFLRLVTEQVSIDFKVDKGNVSKSKGVIPSNGKIVFVSSRDDKGDGNREIYVMNADGTGQKRLTIDIKKRF